MCRKFQDRPPGPREGRGGGGLYGRPRRLDALSYAYCALQTPKDYVFVDALPKNNYGKILKTELRAMDAKVLNAKKTTR